MRLSHRYISGRQLPDKAVSLLDTACARVAIGHAATPPAVEDCRRRIEQLSVAIDILERENAAGADHRQRARRADAEQGRRPRRSWPRWKPAGKRRRSWSRRSARSAAAGMASAQPRHRPLPPGEGQAVTARAAAATGRTSSADAIAPPLAPEQRDQLRNELHDLDRQLKALQGETPLMQVCVDGQAVAEVVSGWTGIPVGRMVTDEIRTVLELKQRMEQRIVGQSHALEAIAQRIRTSRANLTDPRRPIGVFLLVGPSGVGKTETAITLAELLYGGDQNMTVINMSEFKEEHKVSLLMGSPPGYVGYGEGGVLTEAVRRRPYSVVLLDEMEKAHPGVQDIFYQVFDKGMLRDGEGRDIDFKNTVIMMTSNAGTDLIMKLCADPETAPDAGRPGRGPAPGTAEDLQAGLPGPRDAGALLPAGRRRHAADRGIAARADRPPRARRTTGPRSTYDPELVAGIAGRCTEVESGARNVDHILTRTLLPEMSAEFLAAWPTARRSSRSACRWPPTGNSSTSFHGKNFSAKRDNSVAGSDDPGVQGTY